MIEPLLALVLALPLGAAGPVTAPSGAPAPGAEDGIYTAPMPADDAAAPAAAGSRLSRARVEAFAWGRPGVALPGVEISLDGEPLGRTPLALDGVLVSAAGVSLAAQADGFEEALRPRVELPEEGRVSIALLPRDAADAVTTPGWIAGLGLVAAGLLAYRSDNPGPGLGLAGGGLLCAGLTQLWARWVTLPRLRAAVAAYNGRIQPEPAP